MKVKNIKTLIKSQEIKFPRKENQRFVIFLCCLILHAGKSCNQYVTVINFPFSMLIKYWQYSHKTIKKKFSFFNHKFSHYKLFYCTRDATWNSINAVVIVDNIVTNFKQESLSIASRLKKILPHNDRFLSNSLNIDLICLLSSDWRWLMTF